MNAGAAGCGLTRLKRGGRWSIPSTGRLIRRGLEGGGTCAQWEERRLTGGCSSSGYAIALQGLTEQTHMSYEFFAIRVMMAKCWSLRLAPGTASDTQVAAVILADNAAARQRTAALKKDAWTLIKSKNAYLNLLTCVPKQQVWQRSFCASAFALCQLQSLLLPCCLPFLSPCTFMPLRLLLCCCFAGGRRNFKIQV